MTHLQSHTVFHSPETALVKVFEKTTLATYTSKNGRKFCVWHARRLTNELPMYLHKLLVDSKPARELRSSIAHLLVVLPRTLKHGERAFSFKAPTLWNELPNHIKLSQSNFGVQNEIKESHF